MTIAARLLTVRQACALMGVHPATFYRNRDEYPFNLVKMPGCRHAKIDRLEIEAFIEAMKKRNVGEIVGEENANAA